MHRIVPTACKKVQGAAPQKPKLYLSFDDGPDPDGTLATLEILERYGARASFFVVAHQAQRWPKIIEQTVRAGHSLGNHSLDHSWRPFFQSHNRLQQWIEEADRILFDLSGQKPIGFRSPAGVITPPLTSVLRQLNMPLIHWNKRFFDAIWPWDQNWALQSLDSTPAGSIILLHDRQRPRHRRHFIQTLELYVRKTLALGFQLEPIPAGLLPS